MIVSTLCTQLLSFSQALKDAPKITPELFLDPTNKKIKLIAQLLQTGHVELVQVKKELDGITACLKNIQATLMQNNNGDSTSEKVRNLANQLLNLIQAIPPTKPKEQLLTEIMKNIIREHAKPSPNFVAIIENLELLRQLTGFTREERLKLIQKFIPEKEREPLLKQFIGNNQPHQAYLLTIPMPPGQTQDDYLTKIVQLLIQANDFNNAEGIASKISKKAQREQLEDQIKKDRQTADGVSSLDLKGRVHIQYPQLVIKLPQNVMHLAHEPFDEAVLLSKITSLESNGGITDSPTAHGLIVGIVNSKDQSTKQRGVALLIDWYIIHRSKLDKTHSLIKLVQPDRQPALNTILDNAVKKKIEACRKEGAYLEMLKFVTHFNEQEMIPFLQSIPEQSRESLFQMFMSKQAYGVAVLCILGRDSKDPKKDADLAAIIKESLKIGDLKRANSLIPLITDNTKKEELQKDLAAAKERIPKENESAQGMHPKHAIPQGNPLAFIEQTILQQWQKIAFTWWSLAHAALNKGDQNERSSAIAEMNRCRLDLIAKTEKQLEAIDPTPTKIGQEEVLTLLKQMKAIPVVKHDKAAIKLKAIVDLIPSSHPERDKGVIALINWYISQKEFTEPVRLLILSMNNKDESGKLMDLFLKNKQQYLADLSLKQQEVVEMIDGTDAWKQKLKAMDEIWGAAMSTVLMLRSKPHKIMLYQGIIARLHKLQFILEMLQTKQFHA